MELRSHSELPLWPGAVWRYTDRAGEGWRDPRFDDAGWAEGPAPLGYGGDHLATELVPPTDSSLTTYFRAAFTPASRSEITHLDLGLDRHDGAAVYLNGVEVLRENLDADAGPETPAWSAVPPTEGNRWTTAELRPDLLTDGVNLVAVEVHRAVTATDQLRFDLYLEASGDSVSADLLGMGAEDDWILNGEYTDRALFRNRLAFDLFRSFGDDDRYATDTRFCELHRDGAYQGLYTLGEKLDRGDDRIDIGSGDAPGDSFVIKLDDVDGFHDNAVGYGTWQLVYPDETPAELAAVSEVLAGWEAAVLGPDPADPEHGVFAYLDLDSAVDWVLLNELMKNQDAYLLSVHLWRDEGGKMFFAPWDLDLSLGSYPAGDCGPEGWNGRSWHAPDGSTGDLAFIEVMASVPAFHDALLARWAELRQGVLADEALRARIAGYDAVLAPGLDANVALWPVDEIAFSTPGVPDWLCPADSYEDEHAKVLAFLSERLLWIDDHLSTF